MMWAVQAVGFVAFLVEAFSVQFKKRQHIIAMLIIGELLFGIHFYLLHSYVGAAIGVISVFRLMVFYRIRQQKPSLKILYGFWALFIIAGFLTWQGWASGIPLVCMLVTTYGLWQKNEQILRWTFLIVAPFWTLYGFLVGSFGIVCNEIFNSLSTIAALYRYRKKRRSRR